MHWHWQSYDKKTIDRSDFLAITPVNYSENTGDVTVKGGGGLNFFLKAPSINLVDIICGTHFHGVPKSMTDLNLKRRRGNPSGYRI